MSRRAGDKTPACIRCSRSSPAASVRPNSRRLPVFEHGCRRGKRAPRRATCRRGLRGRTCTRAERALANGEHWSLPRLRRHGPHQHGGEKPSRHRPDASFEPRHAECRGDRHRQQDEHAESRCGSESSQRHQGTVKPPIASVAGPSDRSSPTAPMTISATARRRVAPSRRRCGPPSAASAMAATPGEPAR